MQASVSRFLCGAIAGICLCVPVLTASAADRQSASHAADASNGASLVDAAENQQWSRIASLLQQQNAPVGAAQPDGMTALHWAVFHKHLPTVEALIKAGAEVDARTRYDVTPLSIASQYGHGPIVARLLDADADANTSHPGGTTVLMLAARTGKLKPVKELIEHGAEVDAEERNGQTALMWAAAEGHAEVVEALVVAGAEIDRSLDSGMNAMMFAAREGKPAVVQRLLALGVDVNAAIDPKGNPRGRDPRRGMSALMFALESGHFELAAMLLDEGADPNDQRSGYAPLHAMTWVRKANRGEGHDGDPIPRGSGSLSSVQFIQDLIHHGADVNLALRKGSGGGGRLNSRGATPFLLASRTADLEYLKILIDAGADPFIPNVDGSTPIMAAAGVGVRAVGEEAGTEPEVLATVSYLAELGADPNVIDDNGETAVHGAALRNFPKVVTLLCELGADPHVWHRKNERGWTPHLIAQGFRPGSFKPSPPTIAAIESAMLAAGLEKPPMRSHLEGPKEDRWENKKKAKEKWQAKDKKATAN